MDKLFFEGANPGVSIGEDARGEPWETKVELASLLALGMALSSHQSDTRVKVGRTVKRHV